jgi:molybdate transport system regulatory protein
MRVVLGKGAQFGPGKADLLAAIESHGSIAAAGRSMGMSYQRAWSLIDELNAIFREPVVTVSRGGSRGGGAMLTKTGRTVLDRYRAIERTAAASCQKELREIARLARQEFSEISGQR